MAADWRPLALTGQSGYSRSLASLITSWWRRYEGKSRFHRAGSRDLGEEREEWQGKGCARSEGAKERFKGPGGVGLQQPERRLGASLHHGTSQQLTPPSFADTTVLSTVSPGRILPSARSSHPALSTARSSSGRRTRGPERARAGARSRSTCCTRLVVRSNVLPIKGD